MAEREENKAAQTAGRRGIFKRVENNGWLAEYNLFRAFGE
jgi:hypothetical protein